MATSSPFRVLQRHSTREVSHVLRNWSGRFGPYRRRPAPRVLTVSTVVSIGKTILLQVAGWLLVLFGLAALVLPGPGLLALFAGIAILATHYEWAERHIVPVEQAALRGAEASVKTWPRILLSASGAFLAIGLGVYWGLGPSAPSWWPVSEKWWLMGGWGTGASLILSGVIAFGLLAYSYLRFRPRQG